MLGKRERLVKAEHLKVRDPWVRGEDGSRAAEFWELVLAGEQEGLGRRRVSQTGCSLLASFPVGSGPGYLILHGGTRRLCTPYLYFVLCFEGVK